MDLIHKKLYEISRLRPEPYVESKTKGEHTATSARIRNNY